MPISLEEFVQQVPDFRKLPEPEKIKHFVWYAHRAEAMARIGAPKLRAMYDLLHIQVPNLSLNLRRLNERTPRVLLKDANGFFLEGTSRDSLDKSYLNIVTDPIVQVSDLVLPTPMIKGTRKYLEEIAKQVNGCYEFQFYDGCAVLMRRLIESLLIDAFVKAGHVDQIRKDGEFMMLEKIISVAKGGQYIRLARGSDKILEEIKYVGDRSAHNRNYISHKRDVGDLINKFRTVVAELLHLADIQAT
jgi:hypothetical protein